MRKTFEIPQGHLMKVRILQQPKASDYKNYAQDQDTYTSNFKSVNNVQNFSCENIKISYSGSLRKGKKPPETLFPAGYATQIFCVIKI